MWDEVWVESVACHLSYCKLMGISEFWAETMSAVSGEDGRGPTQDPSAHVSAHPTRATDVRLLRDVAGIVLDHFLAAPDRRHPPHQPLNNAVIRPRSQLRHLDPDRRCLGR